MIQGFVVALLRLGHALGRGLAAGFSLMFGSGERLVIEWEKGVSDVDAPQYARATRRGSGACNGSAFGSPLGPIPIEWRSIGRGTGA